MAAQLRAMHLTCLLALAMVGCVNLPDAGTFKYATAGEREDALAAVDGTDPADTAGQTDVVGNDTAGVDAAADADVDGSTDAATGTDANAGTDAAADADADVASDADVSAGADADTVNAGDTVDAGDTLEAGDTPDVVVPACVQDADCADMWTVIELGACQVPKCDAGQCVKAPVSGPCDDGSVCTGTDICQAGVCTGTAQINCDDSDACTADVCDKATGCQHLAGKGCDDANNCTDDSCDANNQCVHLPASATCSDGDACTIGDACVDVSCVALGPTQCVDSNPCTDDSCASATGCVFLPNAVTCDDGDICTTADLCAGGTCAGVADTCDDANVCTDDTCTPGVGCSHVFNYAPCSDGDACTPGDLCKKGTCVGLAVAATDLCDDANVCTDDACDATLGCQHTANTASCEDGQPCTIDDTCAGSKCVGGTYACECTKDTDCAPMEDGNPCNGTLKCDTATAPYKCVVNSKTVVVCNTASDGPCAKNTCNVVNGLCSIKAQNEGGACDADGSICTSGDTCQTGVCTAGAALNCNDGLICTTDTCDKTGGCVNTPNTLPCNDGNGCTVGDSCGAGKCNAGALTICDDKNPCTTDSCSAGTGECAYVENALDCDDGNACSDQDKCKVGGVCTGVAKSCDDSNACTSDTCDPAVGCVNAPNTLPCDDGNKCTTGDVCGGSVCLGAAVTATTYCDDNNECTTDTCDKIGGCAHNPIAGSCSDNNSCTEGDTCVAGVCQAGANKCGCLQDIDCAPYDDPDLCNGTLYCDKTSVTYKCAVKPGTVVTCSTTSDNSCRKNTCNPVTGTCALVAQNENGACDADGTVCTNPDACKSGVCIAGSSANCDDQNPCTTDSCDAATGCKNVANSLPCSDGNACTLSDTCANSACAAGTAKVCNDNNVCTTDSCNQASGACQYVNNTIGCDDGSVCTTNDTCNAGGCVGTKVTCEDNNVCTDNSCDTLLGCQYTANKVSCTDGNACTLNDACSNKSCVPGTTKDCTDGEVCTDDGCTAATGACTHTYNALSCNDGNACTTPDVCSGGKCGGAAVTCNDQNACTTDSCSPAQGCVYTVTVTCDDGNACTVDSCAKADAKCTHVASTLYGSACDDGNPCTSGDYCWYVLVNGAPDTSQPPYCAMGSGWGCDDANGCTFDSCSYASGGAPSCLHTTVSSGQPCGVCATVGASTSYTGGTCSGATCTLSGNPQSCEDNNMCTDDSCGTVLGTLGCSHLAKVDKECDDGTVCTDKDTCAADGTCVGMAVCDDNNSCTADQCQLTDGGTTYKCSNTPLGKYATCDDGDACTINDQCDADAKCTADSLKCDDGLACTLDGCDSKTGCTASVMAGITCQGSNQCPGGSCLNGFCYIPCDDGNPCTSADNCSGTACIASGISGATACNTSANCGGGACINGYCANTCDDGLACTTSDACVSGTCAGTAKVCNDNNKCTNDSCSASTGSCVFAAKCDDGNPCTVDSCLATTGTCSYANAIDMLQCNGSNTCKSGVCVACPAGTVSTAVDDNGTKLTVCAFDYPVWGLRPMALPVAGFVNNADNTISDPTTGLQWMQGSYSGQSKSDAAYQCDVSTYGSRNDWRLPTVAELQSLNDYVYTASSVPAAFYGQGSSFWTQIAASGTNGFDINTSTGTTESSAVATTMNVRCVRAMPSTTPPATRYTVSSDNVTVYDAVTGLVWQRSASNSGATATVAAANTTCSNLGLGWRLPTIRELESIVDRTNAPTSFFNTSAFPSPIAGAYWTISQLTPGASNVNWYVNFVNGTSATANNATANLGRCVLNCDDGNPCTTDSFDKPTWACKHTALADGLSCGGTGICYQGNCTCAVEGIGWTADDAGTPKFMCTFDYPAWGIPNLTPGTLSANGDGTVTDNKSKLMWQQSDAGNSFNWSSAKQYCDSVMIGDYADWRLPTVAELDSIFDYNSTGTTLFASPFTNNAASTRYWTGRPLASNTSNYWYMMSNDASTATSGGTGNFGHVRCVRGGLTTALSYGSHFTNQGGTPVTIKDNATGLIWQQSNTGSSALYAAQATSCAGLSGGSWRIPNIRELNSALDRSLSTAPFWGGGMFSGGNFTFWSSTSAGITQNFTVGFGTGYVGSAGTLTNTNAARCVK